MNLKSNFKTLKDSHCFALFFNKAISYGAGPFSCGFDPNLQLTKFYFHRAFKGPFILEKITQFSNLRHYFLKSYFEIL